MVSPQFEVLLSVASLAEVTGGPARSVPSLANALKEHVNRVHLATLDLERDLGPSTQMELAEVTIHTAPGRHFKSIRIVFSRSYRDKIRKICDQFKIALIHDNGLWLQTNHDMACLARELKIPRVVSPRGMATEWAMGHKAWKKYLAWRLFQRIDLSDANCLHATSFEEARALRDLGLTVPIAVIPNGVGHPPQNWKEERGFPTKEIGRTRIVLFVSRINPKKGLLNLVHAWARLKPQGWKVVVAGPDENGHKREVVSLLSSYGIGRDFEFLGNVDDARKWVLYSQADVFALPTYSENFGMSIAEALASGVPVITTHGAPWSVIARERCGWWIEIGVEPLVAALREAMNLSDNDRWEMGVRGRAYASVELDWSAVGRKMIDLYKWLLHGGVAPKFLI